MRPNIQIIRPGHVPIDLVKLAVCAIIFTHGIHRYLYGELGALGGALAHFGLPFPQLQAHLINVAETFGTVLIALGLFVRPCCAVLVVIFLTGIALIHSHAGFFILGPGDGGWEYSALLIACFTAVALDYPSEQRPNSSSKPTPLPGAA